MQAEWSCQIQSVVFGPMTPQDLKRMAARGSLWPGDLVRRGRDGRWVRARLVKGLVFAQDDSLAIHPAPAQTSLPPIPTRSSIEPARKRLEAFSRSRTPFVLWAAAAGIFLLLSIAGIVILSTKRSSSADRTASVEVASTNMQAQETARDEKVARDEEAFRAFQDAARAEKQAGEDYEKAAEAYRGFLAKYPNASASLRQSAQLAIDREIPSKIEDRDYRRSVRAAEASPPDPKAASLLRAYLKRHEGGYRADKVRQLQDVAEAFQEAQAAEKAAGDEYEQAIEAYERFLQQHPDCPRGYRSAARTKIDRELPNRLEGRNWNTEKIVSRCASAVALIRGKSSSGTGFLIQPGVLATNAHVIADELIENLRISFPSADAASKGPHSVHLLYEDKYRDLAFLTVSSNLAPLRLARQHRFRSGQDITVIGNPSLGGQALANAVSRGVMSTTTRLNERVFYQLNIAVNPGNSGGPVLDAAGQVIGVVTAKATNKEGVAFCIPLEDFRRCLSQLPKKPEKEEVDRVESRHRLEYVVVRVVVTGYMYRFLLMSNEYRAALKKEGWQHSQWRRATYAAVYDAILEELRVPLAAVNRDSSISREVRQDVAALRASAGKMKKFLEMNNLNARSEKRVQEMRVAWEDLLAKVSLHLDLKYDLEYATSRTVIYGKRTTSVTLRVKLPGHKRENR